MNNYDSWVSDGTYLAFKYFMENIVPEYMEKGLINEEKTIYVFIYNQEDGVTIGSHKLGQIEFSDFMRYISRLRSFKGFSNSAFYNIQGEFIAPFDFELLTYDYYEYLQKEEYRLFDRTLKGNNYYVDSRNLTKEELTNQAFDNFKSVIVGNILARENINKYQQDDILDKDNAIILSRLYLPLEINKDDLFIGEYNLGKINYLLFLERLTEMPAYLGTRALPDSFEVVFDLNQLIYDDIKTYSR